MKPKLPDHLTASLPNFRRVRPLNLFLLLIAGIINAIGVTMFLAPVNLYDSGISGTAMLLWQITPDEFTFPLFLLVLNIPLFLFGLKKQGKLFTLYSIWAVTIYSLASWCINYVLPVNVDGSSPFAGTDLLLCAIFGGLISGVGSGLTLRLGGAIDGMEVLASIFAKKIGLSVGNFVMIYNVILYITIGASFRSWILPLYSIITYFVAVRAVDFIVEGLDKAKSVMIVTTKTEEICKVLSADFGHGITLLKVQGYYSGEDRYAIYFVVNRFQITRVKNEVRHIDPRAFFVVTEVSDMLGTSLRFKMLK